jgi:dipeptidase E
VAAATTARATIAAALRRTGGRAGAPVACQTVDERRIVAMGGGGFSMEPENPLLDDFVLSLARRSPARITFVATAGGDHPTYVADFYRAFAARDCRPSDIGLFDRRIADLRGHVLAHDVVYVGGGNTASMLATWRAHGLDRVLTEAWHAGVVLCGLSAGMNCWFEQSVTDSFHADTLAPLDDGLGLLRGSACPHFDGEEQRRPTYRRLVEAGVLRDGWAADDGAALVFRGEALEEVVASRPAAAAYRVERTAEGVDERRVDARFLGAPG